MKTYHLISTTNAQIEGWNIYATGTKEECKKALDTNSAFNDTTQLHVDIYAQTLRRNAKIVSKTTAKRKYSVDANSDYELY